MLLFQFALFLAVFGTGVLCYTVNSANLVSRHVHNLGIYNGIPVNITEAPFMAQLNFGSDEWWCGAVIIHEQFLVTAGHCVSNIRKENLIITVGSDLALYDGEEYEIEKIFLHPKYSHLRYDIAVIKLENNLAFSDQVKPIKMANSSLILEPGDMMETFGFGLTEDGYTSGQLLSVKLPFVDRSTCQKNYNYYDDDEDAITDEMICAGGEEGKGTCFGDSGGPLIYKGQLIGINSWGVSLCRMTEYPSVFSYVPSMRDFIDEVIKKNTMS